MGEIGEHKLIDQVQDPENTWFIWLMRADPAIQAE
jgi:hypothetical protein